MAKNRSLCHFGKARSPPRVNECKNLITTVGKWRNISDMLRSVLVGLMLGLLSFAASGWIVYSGLWWLTGQDAIQRSDGTPGVVLGGVWSFGVGIISGALIGVFTALLTTVYLHRRGRRENSPQKSSLTKLA